MILLMRALVSRPDAPFAEMAEVPDPAPTPDEAIVAVHAFSLNRGECNRLATMAPGTVAGWDLAGEVVQAAADGTGPGVGARVVGLVNLGALGRARRRCSRVPRRAARGDLLRGGGGAARRGPDRAALARAGGIRA